MNTVDFGEFNSYEDFSLILTSKTIGKAEPKTETVDIPGGDGVIDYTEYFGDVKFKNRWLTFEFKTKVPPSEFIELFSTVQNTLHGKVMQVRLSEEPGMYYRGRIHVDEWKSNGRIGKVTVDVDAEPWKYKNEPTVQNLSVSGGGNFEILNSRKSAIPNITVTANMQITFNGVTYSLVPGTTYNDSGITFRQGKNYISATGTGIITFTWQEGGL